MPNEREIFDRLFLRRKRIRINDLAREVMVLVLATFYKYDEVLLREKGRGITLTADEIASIQVSEHRLTELEDIVEEALRRHVDQRRPAPAFRHGVWQNIVAAFLYSLLLAIVAFTLAFSNFDPLKLIGIEIKALPPAPSG
jgi:hypothetical protein